VHPPPCTCWTGIPVYFFVHKQSRRTLQSDSGATLCRNHGGSAPQVKRRAKERLAALVDPAIAALSKLVRSKGSTTVKLNAARDILDRNGIKLKETVVIEGDIVSALNRGLARNGKPQITEEGQGNA
jgi:hypothetical protein